MVLLKYLQTNKTDSVALSPQANYTDWATAIKVPAGEENVKNQLMWST
jgi:hypothetical protein